MEQVLDFKLKLPSLKELAKIRIARSLWYIQDFSKYVNSAVANELPIPLQNNVKSQIPLLPIPKLLTKDLGIYVHFVGQQIHDITRRFVLFINSLDCYFDFANFLKNDYFINEKLRWTANGTVDVRHLAGLLIRDVRMPVAGRYEIACQCCFQEDIERIWNEMKPQEFHQKNLREIKNNRKFLVYYWSCFMKGELGHFFGYHPVDLGHSPTEIVFDIIRNNLFGCDSNEIALEYFWNKMTEEEQRRQIERLKKEGYVLTILCNLGKCEAFCYLLSQMDPDEQTDSLKRSPVFLKMFLNRPWQHLFFPVLRLVEGCQTFKKSLASFLAQISLKQCDENMRRQLFDHLRPLLPEYVYNKPQFGRNFRSMLREGEHEYVLEIMRDATEAQKIAFLMDTFEFDYGIMLHDDIPLPPVLEILVEAWVTLDGWPHLKVKLKRIFHRLYGSLSDPSVRPESTNFIALIDSLDRHFAS